MRAIVQLSITSIFPSIPPGGISIEEEETDHPWQHRLPSNAPSLWQGLVTVAIECSLVPEIRCGHHVLRRRRGASTAAVCIGDVLPIRCSEATTKSGRGGAALGATEEQLRIVASAHRGASSPSCQYRPRGSVRPQICCRASPVAMAASECPSRTGQKVDRSNHSGYCERLVAAAEEAPVAAEEGPRTHAMLGCSYPPR
jgi:hypothetical protein